MSDVAGFPLRPGQVMCECGSAYQHAGRAKHMRTKKHTAWLIGQGLAVAAPRAKPAPKSNSQIVGDKPPTSLPSLDEVLHPVKTVEKNNESDIVARPKSPIVDRGRASTEPVDAEKPKKRENVFREENEENFVSAEPPPAKRPRRTIKPPARLEQSPVDKPDIVDEEIDILASDDDDDDDEELQPMPEDYEFIDDDDVDDEELLAAAENSDGEVEFDFIDDDGDSASEEDGEAEEDEYEESESDSEVEQAEHDDGEAYADLDSQSDLERLSASASPPPVKTAALPPPVKPPRSSSQAQKKARQKRKPAFSERVEEPSLSLHHQRPASFAVAHTVKTPNFDQFF